MGRPRRDEESPRIAITIRVSAWVYDMLKQKAEAEGFSLSEIANRRLSLSLNRERRGQQ